MILFLKTQPLVQNNEFTGQNVHLQIQYNSTKACLRFFRISGMIKRHSFHLKRFWSILSGSTKNLKGLMDDLVGPSKGSLRPIRCPGERAWWRNAPCRWKKSLFVWRFTPLLVLGWLRGQQSLLIDAKNYHQTNCFKSDFKMWSPTMPARIFKFWDDSTCLFLKMKNYACLFYHSA